jgi:NTE family protein
MGSTWNGEGSFKLKDQAFGGSLFLGIDTILGPIYLAQGFGEGGRRVSYFFLGRSF